MHPCKAGFIGVIVTFSNAAFATETAIGRLNYAGYREQLHCSAVLIAPNAALTAAHCIYNKDVREMYFLSGYDHGDWTEELRPTGVKTLQSRDSAVLCLTRARKSDVFHMSKTPAATGETLFVIGYPVPRMHVQNRATCVVNSVDSGGKITLSCPMEHGASGAPLLRQTVKGLEIVGLISASDGTRSIAYATGPEAAVACR